MFTDAIDFYPTPAHLAEKMAQKVAKYELINSILEPSAGKGDLLPAVQKKMKYAHNRYRDATFDIDCIEPHRDCQHILKGNGYRVVHDNFLTYHTRKQYDLIIMNPPFSQGARHLLHALELIRNGGQVVCILNAETLRNPCTQERTELLQQLDEASADIEYITDAFIDAERKTGVDIALIYVKLERKTPISNILENLKAAAPVVEDAPPEYGPVVQTDFVKGFVKSYELEVSAGINLIQEFQALSPTMRSKFKRESDKYDHSRSIFELTIGGKDATVNSFLQSVRYKYWHLLFDHPEFMGKLTSNLREDYYRKLEELQDYDFSLFNIYSIEEDMSKHVVTGIEDTIMELFDTLSSRHSYNDEYSKNTHYYNGWKTNDAFKINKKVIIPLNTWGYWGERYNPTDYRVVERLQDVEKVISYLDTGKTTAARSLESALRMAEAHGITKKIESKYFLMTFYKKGTCHLEFKDQELLDRFNRFGSQKRGWLPPSYGRKKYNDMTAEEKEVINQFEGEVAYTKVMQDPAKHLVTITPNMLTA